MFEIMSVAMDDDRWTTPVDDESRSHPHEWHNPVEVGDEQVFVVPGKSSVSMDDARGTTRVDDKTGVLSFAPAAGCATLLPVLSLIGLGRAGVVRVSAWFVGARACMGTASADAAPAPVPVPAAYRLDPEEFTRRPEHMLLNAGIRASCPVAHVYVLSSHRRRL